MIDCRLLRTAENRKMIEGLIVVDYLCRMVVLNLSYTLNHLGDLEGEKKLDSAPPKKL